ncbi:MAG: hypothetical protein GY863_18750, partial [bacterium]|nr:hypothetical protein [bacterium]
MSDNVKNSFFKDVYPLILCVLGILSGLLFFSNNDIYNCLKSGESEEQIRQTAGELMEYLGYSSDRFEQTVSKNTVDRLIEYIQRKEIGHNDAIDLPIYRWRVDYTFGEPGRVVETDSGIEVSSNEFYETGYERITIRFDPGGMLHEIDLSSKAEEVIEEQIRQTLQREDSERFAREFINKYSGIDTSSLELISRNILQQQGGKEDIAYEFEHKDSRFPGLADNISLTISGGRVREFNRDISTDDVDLRRTEEIMDIVFAILTGIAWIIVIVIAIYIFITKARKDQLEFIKIWWIGGFTMVSLIGILASDDPD